MLELVQGWWNLVDDSLDGTKESINSIQVLLNIAHK